MLKYPVITIIIHYIVTNINSLPLTLAALKEDRLGYKSMSNFYIVHICIYLYLCYIYKVYHLL